MKITKSNNHLIPPVFPGQKSMLDLRKNRNNQNQQNSDKNNQNNQNDQTFQQILDQKMNQK